MIPENLHDSTTRQIGPFSIKQFGIWGIAIDPPLRPCLIEQASNRLCGINSSYQYEHKISTNAYTTSIQTTLHPTPANYDSRDNTSVTK